MIIKRSLFTPLENCLDTTVHSIYNNGLCKIIYNKSSNNQIVGMHYLGPNAGDVMQGYHIAARNGNGMTLETMDNSICIHPSNSE